MLRFDLHQSSTIDISGKHFDKTTILKTIQTLETEADFHIRVNRNGRLLQFLENGNLQFFYDLESWKDLKDPVFQDELRPYFVHRFSQTIYQAVSNPKGNGIYKLDRIFKSKFELPVTYQEEAYAKTFRFLEKMTIKARDKFSQPFENFKKITLKRDVEQYYNAHFREVFLTLPISFETLKQRYWAAGRVIVYLAFKEEIKFTRFERKTLKKLLEISNICNDLNYEKEMVALRDDIDKYVNKKWSMGQMTYLFIFGSVILGRLILAIVGNNSMSTSPPNYKFPTSVVQQKDWVGTWDTTFKRKGEADLSRTLTLLSSGEGSAEFILPLGQDREKECVLIVPLNWSFENTFLHVCYEAVFERNCKIETTRDEAAINAVLLKIETEIAGMETKEKQLNFNKKSNEFYCIDQEKQKGMNIYVRRIPF